MPRALWTGSISFGLVNVPVRLYSAVSEHKLQFHFVHEKDDSPIGYQKICKKEDKPVPDEEIVKAFEYRKGEYVFMEDEDFEAAQVEGYKTIDITDFVPYEEIDPIYFAHTYYVGPSDGAEKVYSLLVQGDGGLGAGSDRQVRHARPAVPRRPAVRERSNHARAAPLRRRDPAGRRAQGRSGRGSRRRAADGAAADRQLLRASGSRSSTRTPTATHSARNRGETEG